MSQTALEAKALVRDADALADKPKCSLKPAPLCLVTAMARLHDLTASNHAATDMMLVSLQPTHLCAEASETQHSQAAVLDLLELQGGQVALAVAQGVEDATGVAHLTVRQLVVGEDGVLVHTAGLADVLQPG